MLWWTRGGENKQLARIEALEKAVESHASAARLMKIEWESVLHKVNQVMGRLNARIRKADAEKTPDGVDVVENTPAPAPGSHAVLTHFRRNRGVLSR